MRPHEKACSNSHNIRLCMDDNNLWRKKNCLHYLSLQWYPCNSYSSTAAPVWRQAHLELSFERLFWREEKQRGLHTPFAPVERGSDPSQAFAMRDSKHLNKAIKLIHRAQMSSSQHLYGMHHLLISQHQQSSIWCRKFAPGLPSKALPSRQVRPGQVSSQALFSQGPWLWVCYVIIRVMNLNTYIIEFLHHLQLDFIKGTIILFFNHLITVHPVWLMQVELH